MLPLLHPNCSICHHPLQHCYCRVSHRHNDDDDIGDDDRDDDTNDDDDNANVQCTVTPCGGVDELQPGGLSDQ